MYYLEKEIEIFNMFWGFDLGFSLFGFIGDDCDGLEDI